MWWWRKRGCGQVEVGLFSHVPDDRTRKNSFYLCQERFGLDIMEKFFTKRAVKHWKRLLRAVVASPFLELI